MSQPESTGAARGTRNRRSKTMVWVSALFAVAFISFISHEWGATIHSIIGLGTVGVVAWHLYTQRRWVRSVIARRTRHPETKLMILNTGLALTFLTVIISGLPVWITGTRGAVEQIHEFTGLLFLPFVLAHLVLNRRRLAAALRRPAR